MSEAMALLWQVTLETLYMVCFAALFRCLGGLVGGVLLVVTAGGNVATSPVLHRVLASAANIGRSIPFIILMVTVVPLTRWIVGTSSGTEAATVPLILATIPYVSRLVESALLEVDGRVIEAVMHGHHAVASHHKGIPARGSAGAATLDYSEPDDARRKLKHRNMP
jgi:D-methionine transport system permease protein